MTQDLEGDPRRAAELCRAAHERLLRTARALGPEQVSAPSRLPGWTVAHVLTHLARNADAHGRRLAGSLRGQDVPKYVLTEQRQDEIKEGAHRSAAEIVTDLETSVTGLHEIFDRCAVAGWPNGHLRGGGTYGAAGCPAHRLREVEQHHVDLGLGYTPADWPAEYVAWDLPVLLATVPDRLPPEQVRGVTAWLAGRGPLDPTTTLTPW